MFYKSTLLDKYYLYFKILNKYQGLTFENKNKSKRYCEEKHLDINIFCWQKCIEF